MQSTTKKTFPPTKTAAQVLDELGLAHTEDHLRIAQAGIEENAQLRASVWQRIAGVKVHLDGFNEKIKKLGVEDVGGLIVRFILQKRELDRVRPLRDETELALREAIQMIPSGPEKSNFVHCHDRAIRRAKTLRMTPSRPNKSGPSL